MKEEGSRKRVPEFLCHVKFKNTIPDPAVPSRLVSRAVDLSNFVPYRVTSLERNQVYDTPFEILQTPLLEFVDLEKFKPSANEYLATEDEVLLQPVEGGTSAGQHSHKRESQPSGDVGRGQRSEVTWLRRTEYLSTDSSKKGRSMQSTSNANGERLHQAERIKLETKEDVIRMIESSFSSTTKPLVHPTNSNLRATAVYPILPSFEEPESFAQCTFDADPFVASIDGIRVSKEGEQRALMKAMSNANDPDDTFVWYYLPIAEGDAQEGLEKAERMVYTRDYDIQRVDHRQVTPHFVLSIPEDQGGSQAVYTPIMGHFSLKKRRSKTDHDRRKHTLKIMRKVG